MSILNGRLSLETINYNQVGWNAIHNSNIQKLNSFVEGLAAQDPVLDKDQSIPPENPNIGDRYIIADSPTGSWSDKEKYITEWNGVEWRFTAPFNGMHCYVLDENLYYLYQNNTWSIHEALAPVNTDYLPEGSNNLYYTDARVLSYLGTLSNAINDFRLTLASGIPVTTSNITNAAILYFSPFKGNRISLYNGLKWQLYTTTEKSLSLTLIKDKNYDVFVYPNNSNIPTLELSQPWTNNITRTEELALKDGIYVKAENETRRYIGTIRASNDNVTEDSNVKRFVWNFYNQFPRRLFKSDLTVHSYTTDTYRYWNNDSNNKVEFVIGLSLQDVVLTVSFTQSNSSPPVAVRPGIGLDKTNENNATIVGIMDPTIAGIAVQSLSVYQDKPEIGYHYLSLLEKSGAIGTTIWYQFHSVGEVIG